MSNQETEFYTAQELQKIFGISSSNFERRVKDGTLPPAIKFGAVRRWKKSTIDAWVDSQQHSKEVA